MNPKLKAALIGGIVGGAVAGLPFITEWLCCVFYIAGGVLASYLYLREQPPAAKPPYGDGAVIGLLAGLVGGIAMTVVVMATGQMETAAQEALAAFQEMEQQGLEIPPAVRDFFAPSDGGVSAGLAFTFLLTYVIGFAILGPIGGLIGVAIFHKKETSG